MARWEIPRIGSARLRSILDQEALVREHIRESLGEVDAAGCFAPPEFCSTAINMVPFEWETDLAWPTFSDFMHLSTASNDLLESQTSFD